MLSPKDPRRKLVLVFFGAMLSGLVVCFRGTFLFCCCWLLQLLPRLTSWSAEERLASLRTLVALVSISGSQLVQQLPQLLVQLYGFCIAVDTVPGAARPQHQHQGSPLLLLVQHGTLRDLRKSEVTCSSPEEPWHCGGLQELGACSSLCHSLEAVELALRCAGLVALLMPPCAWLPLIAVHLGLQNEARLYAHRKQEALCADDETGLTEVQADRKRTNAEMAERDFLQQLPGGYRSIAEMVELDGSKASRQAQKAPKTATAVHHIATKGHLCSMEARKQAVLLLARLLRGLQAHQDEVKASEQSQRHIGRDATDSRGDYELGEQELWLLVKIIEHLQPFGSTGTDSWQTAAAAGSAAAADDNDELLPYLGAPLLQLLLAGGSLCSREAHKLFAASLMQHVHPRSHHELAKATVRAQS